MPRMVRRDAEEKLIPEGGGLALACCATPTGESPVPAGVGAPGSRPEGLEGNLRARAGRQEPVRRREPGGGEQAGGPQHEVKPAASTELQPAGRAAHVTAKAAPLAQEPKRDCRAQAGAARLGAVRPHGQRGGSLHRRGRLRGEVAAQPASQARGVQLASGANDAPGPRLLRNSWIAWPAWDDSLPGQISRKRELRAMLRADRPPLVNRVREVRMHGLKEGVGPDPGLRAV